MCVAFHWVLVVSPCFFFKAVSSPDFGAWRRKNPSRWETFAVEPITACKAMSLGNEGPLKKGPSGERKEHFLVWEKFKLCLVAVNVWNITRF